MQSFILTFDSKKLHALFKIFMVLSEEMVNMHNVFSPQVSCPLQRCPSLGFYLSVISLMTPSGQIQGC